MFINDNYEITYSIPKNKNYLVNNISCLSYDFYEQYRIYCETNFPITKNIFINNKLNNSDNNNIWDFNGNNINDKIEINK